MKALLIDDNTANRKILRRFVEHWGHTVVECDNGLEGIRLFSEHLPDLILMDIMMPGIDGIQTAKQIKSLSGNIYTPIIYVSALREDQALSKALEAGGDDYITKPVDKDILFSKIRSHERIRSLNQELEEKNKELLKHNLKLQQEQELVSHFFEKSQQYSDVDVDCISYHTSPASAFNGDVFLIKRKPDGSITIILGDFTGHGLTAAIGSLPLTEIFFRLVENDIPLAKIASEINAKLYQLLPGNIFLAANLVELDKSGQKISIWSGGLPDGYLVNDQHKIEQEIISRHVPLGIFPADKFDSTLDHINVTSNSRMYLYTDGVIEVTNIKGEQFGYSRLINQLTSPSPATISSVIDALQEFAGNTEYHDDITLIELSLKRAEKES